MTQSPYLTAKEAAQLLGISRATLYAYVSRGMIRSEASANSKSRARRYHRADVEALLARKALRENPAKAVETALHWGEPLLPSAITLIQNGRSYHRGQDAIQLAKTMTFEQLAGWLWQSPDLTRFDAALPPAWDTVLPPLREQVAAASPMLRFQTLLPSAASHDLASYDTSPTAVAHTGSRLMQLLAYAATSAWLDGRSLAAHLQNKWVAGQPAAARLLDLALCLCADHELNVSTFTARTVASAGNTPYTAVLAALAALQGARHGGHTERVTALLREVGQPQRAQETIVSRLRRGEPIPGFHHPLYPEGDPRAVLLLAQITAVFPDHEAVQMAQAIVGVVETAVGYQPNIDLALVVLAQVLALPPGSALALFALGRSAGWLAHIMEQYAQNEMIRPRAKYVGIMPE